MFKKYDIFISYRRDNVEAASSIKDKLEKIGYRVFLDKTGLTYGKDFDKGRYGLLANIKKSKCVLLLVDGNFCKKIEDKKKKMKKIG